MGFEAGPRGRELARLRELVAAELLLQVFDSERELAHGVESENPALDVLRQRRNAVVLDEVGRELEVPERLLEDAGVEDSAADAPVDPLSPSCRHDRADDLGELTRRLKEQGARPLEADADVRIPLDEEDGLFEEGPAPVDDLERQVWKRLRRLSDREREVRLDRHLAHHDRLVDRHRAQAELLRAFKDRE